MNEIDWQIGSPNAAYWAFALLIIMAVAAIGYAVRWRQRQRWATGKAGQKTLPPMGKSSLSLTMNLCVVALLILGVMDIRWGKSMQEVQQQGLEIVFALDVSKSMLAEDVSPNRLARAKQQIRDMVEEMAGDRIGLVVFAGTAEQVVPLTRHYEDFLETLELVDPTSVDLGGSRLGIAIECAGEGFMDKTSSARTIVLFTDGEDQESEPIQTASQLHEELGVRVFTVGLGDLKTGATIPVVVNGRMREKRFQGKVVRSKLDGATLQQIADVTNATYVPAGTQQVNMSEFYHDFVANVALQETETASFERYTPRFQWFAGLALMLMVFDCLIQNRGWFLSRPAAVAAMLLVFLCQPESALAQQAVSSRPASKTIQRANQMIADGQLDKAIQELDSIRSETHPEIADRRDYNLGVVYYLSEDFEQAAESFRQGVRSKDRSLAARSRYNLGNTLYQQARQQITPPQSGAGVNAEQLEGAKGKLQDAIRRYRSSLRLEPNHNDARANIEVAFELLSQIQQQQNQQEQQQNSDGPPEDSDSSENESSENDSSEQNESGENESDTQQESGSESQSPEDSEPSNQSSDSDSNEGTQPEDGTEGEADGENPDAQEDGSKPPIDGQLSAKGEPAEAVEAGDEEGESSGEPENRISIEEAMRMLQATRDREMRRRYLQQQRARMRALRRQPVEKDW